MDKNIAEAVAELRAARRNYGDAFRSDHEPATLELIVERCDLTAHVLLVNLVQVLEDHDSATRNAIAFLEDITLEV